MAGHRNKPHRKESNVNPSDVVKPKSKPKLETLKAKAKKAFK